MNSPDELFRTPNLRPKTEGFLLVDNKLTDEALKTWLKDVLADQIHRYYPVVEFIKKVYKFPHRTSRRGNSTYFQLRLANCMALLPGNVITIGLSNRSSTILFGKFTRMETDLNDNFLLTSLPCVVDRQARQRGRS